MYALSAKLNGPDTSTIFTDRGNIIPTEIPTKALNVFDVSLVGNEIQ